MQTCGEMLIFSDILQYVYCNSPWCLPVNYLHLGLLDLDRQKYYSLLKCCPVGVVRCDPILYLLSKTLRNSGAKLLLLNDNCAQTVWKSQRNFTTTTKLILGPRKVHVKRFEIKILDTCFVILQNASILVNEWNMDIYFSKQHQQHSESI